MRHLWHRQRWWMVRIAYLPVQLFCFALVTFFLIRTVPGDPVEMVTGGQYTPEIYARVQKSLGLDGSLPQQLLSYLHKLATFDLGTSLMTNRPITEEIAQKLPATLELALTALTTTLLLTFGLSLLVILRPGNVVSQAARAYARTAGAIPEFALGIIGILLFYATLHWVPAPMGRLSPWVDEPDRITGLPFLDTLLSGDGDAIQSMAAHLVLPIAVMTLSHAPALLKVLLSDLDQAIDAAPTRFRIASGARRWTVLLSVYRRALPATVTLTGTIFGYLLGGALIIELLFGFDGLGKYTVDAVVSSDFTVMQSVVLVVAAMSMIVFLLIDLINMLLDPRRRPGTRVES
jgi:ABC-type dipeptide/oligopeptide/nickel transport system permease component